MKTTYYFRSKDDGICYTKEYFIEEMAFDGLTEMEVYGAIPDDPGNFFFCIEHQFCGEKGDGLCGKDCKEYVPRNGIKGCCKHYSVRTYIHGNKVKLTIS